MHNFPESSAVAEEVAWRWMIPALASNQLLQPDRPELAFHQRSLVSFVLSSSGGGLIKSVRRRARDPQQLMRLKRMTDAVLKSFDHPDETRVFEKGKFEVVRIGGLTIGRATYEPGWKWSVHVSHLAGTTLCEVEHVGVVISGRAVAAMADGRVIELRPGSLFYVPPEPHDSWVVGDEPYVSLHFMGAEQYSK